MSDRTTVTPAEVRGWGNVIGEKTSGDYGLYQSTLSSTTATVDNRSRTVFTLSMVLNSTVLSLSASPSSIYVGTAPVLTGYLKDSNNTGISGVSIKIYRGTSVVDTVTTGSGGAFSFTDSATSSSGSLVYHAVFDGSQDYGASVSSDVTVTVNKINTSLAIDVPLVLVYSDEFNITGTLTDSSDNAVSGKTVDLYVGSTKVDSGTTNSSGVVQFTRTPVSMGNHSFQLKFDGDTVYNNVDSETVTRSIGKETSVLTLTSPVNNSTVYAEDGVTVSGTLTDNDGTAMTGKTIVITESPNTPVTTLTTDSNGAFTGTISSLGNGSHYLVFKFEADDYYTGSSVTRTVIVSGHLYDLSILASSTSILDGQSVTVTGVLKKDGVNWSGQTVTLHVVPSVGASSTSTTTTASDGSYSFTLSSLSSGDGPYTVFVTALDGDVESSEVIISVTAVAPAYLSVTGTKSILSYADSESSVITATVLDSNSSPLHNQAVVFKNGSTTLDTKVTDVNGQCSYTYASTGAGDVTLTVECSLLQETYVLQDCDYYADSTKIGQWGTATSGGTTFRVSSYSIGLTNYSVEMKFNTINTQIIVGNQNSWVTGLAFGGTPCYLYSHSSSGETVVDTISNPVASDVWRIEVEGTTIRLYRNDNLYITKTNCKVDYPKNLRLYPYNTSASVDYVKVKAL